jgi:hypothetical protein
MDKKSKILIFGLFLILAIAMAVTYYRIIIARDYLIEAQTDCDPTIEKCFIYHCDPTIEECTGDTVSDTSYYKISRRKANHIPLCDPSDESCQPFFCTEGETDCGDTFCSEESKMEGDECNDPEQYIVDNPPIAEEEVLCDSVEDPTCEADMSTDPPLESESVDSSTLMDTQQ